MANDSTRRERMARLAPESMTEEQRAAAAELASGPRGEVRGPFNVLLRSPGLMSPVQKVGEYLRFRCALDRRIAEMATLIAARLMQRLWRPLPEVSRRPLGEGRHYFVDPVRGDDAAAGSEAPASTAPKSLDDAIDDLKI